MKGLSYTPKGGGLSYTPRRGGLSYTLKEVSSHILCFSVGFDN